MMFRDREDAGRQLAARLAHLHDEQAPPMVLGLPRGGVVVAAEIARALHAPLDVLIVRKLGAPFQQELAIGAVTDGDQPHYVLNHELLHSLSVDDDYVRHEIDQQYDEVKRRQAFYRGDRPPITLAKRTIIVVDDGIATGATVRAAVAALRQHHPARIILAVPVAAPESLELLRNEVDQIICLAAPAQFTSVGRHYLNFDQTTDQQVIDLLAQAAAASQA